MHFEFVGYVVAPQSIVFFICTYRNGWINAYDKIHQQQMVNYYYVGLFGILRTQCSFLALPKWVYSVNQLMIALHVTFCMLLCAYHMRIISTAIVFNIYTFTACVIDKKNLMTRSLDVEFQNHIHYTYTENREMKKKENKPTNKYIEVAEFP